MHCMKCTACITNLFTDKLIESSLPLYKKKINKWIKFVIFNYYLSIVFQGFLILNTHYLTSRKLFIKAKKPLKTKSKIK